MSSSVDAVVLGVGGVGASALMHLAKRGAQVVGFEQHGVAHDRGSSHGGTRVIRKAYGEGSAYVPLLVRAYELWRELERESGASLLHLVGCLNLGPREHAFIRGVIESARQHSLPHEVLDAVALRERFPVFQPAAGDVGVFESDAGLLAVEDCTRAHVKVAKANGAKLREERVEELVVERDSVVVNGVRARKLVVAAGAWLQSQKWFPELANKLTVRRQVQCWFPRVPSSNDLPCFIHLLDDGRSFYGLPAYGARGPKVCQHKDGQVTTADAVNRATSDADSDPVREYLRAHLPSLDAPPTERKTCLYSMTRDEHFLVGALPDSPVIVLGGFSGHGFKFASVLGEIAADLVGRGRCRFDLSLFNPLR
ncbi:MAG: N-methyl-L-tryptophan oxidase [Archangium sp.]